MASARWVVEAVVRRRGAADPGNFRVEVLLASKFGLVPPPGGGPATVVDGRPERVKGCCEASLRRLGVESIDLYYAHIDDQNTPLDETLRAFDALVTEGKVRHIGASNYVAGRLADALSISDRGGLARYVALQPHYNLAHRQDYEGALLDLCRREGLSCFPYFGLAMGFLTGKYRPGKQIDSPRAGGASAYLNERGLRLLAILDEVAADHHTTVAAVSLAWLVAQPTVGAAIASARTVEQLADLLPVASLKLTSEELARLRSV